MDINKSQQETNVWTFSVLMRYGGLLGYLFQVRRFLEDSQRLIYSRSSSVKDHHNTTKQWDPKWNLCLGWAAPSLSPTGGSFEQCTHIAWLCFNPGKQCSETSAFGGSNRSLQGLLKRKCIIWQELAIRSFHLKQLKSPSIYCVDSYQQLSVYFWCLFSSCNSTP